MKPILSIIIPCYNSESTLKETLESVLQQDYDAWEAIIINDGSPDNLEDIALKWVDKDTRFKYFKKENGGLGSARNYGINKAKGDYVLPLDSDNTISKSFVKKAITIFKENLNVGVVYGDAMYFGEKNELWKVGNFDKYRMMEHNYIDACAIIRKSLFHELGLYDEHIPHQGHEDWDFWLRVIASSYTFNYIEEITFNYRVTSGSMIKLFNEDMMYLNIEYVKKKHWKLYQDVVVELLNENNKLRKSLNEKFINKIKRKLKL